MSNVIFASENYFSNLDSLTTKDWMYKLASTYPHGGITNMSRVMQLELISQLPKETQKEQIRAVVEEMSREQTAYLAHKHTEELQRNMEQDTVTQQAPMREIKAFL